jgi:ketosteroid isomerase-like protein
MTEDDIRVLLDAYEAWNRRENDDVLAEVLHPDMEWEPAFGDLNAGVHHGADGFRAFVDSWLESFDDFRIRPELLVQAGDTVVIRAHQHGRGQGSGIELDAHVVHVWTIRDRLARRWWGPRTMEEAVASLGDERISVVLRGYEAFNRDDVDGALDQLHAEITWHTYLVPGPGGGTYHGHDGVRELWRDARNVFGEFRNEPERVIAAGDRVLAFVRVCGRGKGSGVEVEAKIVHVYTFRDGKVASVESYEDRDEAMRTVGLG